MQSLRTCYERLMLPPQRRLPDLARLVEERSYFVLRAARQTGKTTAMRAFAESLRARGVVAVWATLEESQGAEAVGEAEPIWLRAIHRGACFALPEAERPPDPAAWLAEEPGTRLSRWLGAWCAALPGRTVALLLDEADVVGGLALISLLRQLRAGFMDRGPGRFPSAVGLIGMRDLRDTLAESKDGSPLNPGSHFNIKATRLTLRDFQPGEVAELLGQHTQETGQRFEPEAVDRVVYWTCGQPYLVNALASIAVTELVVNGGGQVTREYAAGRGAVDLVVTYGGERHVVERKRVRPRDRLESVREAGVEQLLRYLRTLAEPRGWLVVFDQRPERPWAERLWAEDRVVEGHTLHLRGA